VGRIPPSGLYYTNMIVRYTIEAMEEIMGKNGLNAILNLAGLSHLIDNYPPDNLNKEFDFADFSSLMGALEDMYGPRGGRGLQLRAGRVGWTRGGTRMGAMVGVADLAFRVLPLNAKLKAGLPTMAMVFTQFSDQKSTVSDRGDHYLYVIHACPVCWGRKADRPICFAAKGLLEEGLHWLSSGLKFRVDEVDCLAMGGQTCSFTVYKEPIG
jgi:hypothetical protein